MVKKSHFSPHLVNFLLTPYFWTICLLVDFQRSRWWLHMCAMFSLKASVTTCPGIQLAPVSPTYYHRSWDSDAEATCRTSSSDMPILVPEESVQDKFTQDSRTLVICESATPARVNRVDRYRPESLRRHHPSRQAVRHNYNTLNSHRRVARCR